MVVSLASGALRHRLFSRLRGPADPGEIRRTERWLATARVFLAISALVAIWMDPGEVRYSPWAYGLLGFYIVHGLVIMLLLRMRQQSTVSFRVLVHAADVVWPALISSFSTSSRDPFFLFFIFVMAAAAYRWGMWETVGTAVSSVILLWLQSLTFQLGFVTWADRLLARHGLPILQVNVADFQPKALFMRSIYLLVLGWLLGYLAGQQKQLRAEKALIARTLGKARVEVGMTGTLQDILGDILGLYGAKQALIASQETGSRHVFVGEVKALSGARTAFNWLEAPASDREVYMYDTAADAVYLRRGRRGQINYVALNPEGLRLRDLSTDFVQGLSRRHQFRDMIIVSYVFGREWSGRIFLLDPDPWREIEEELRFLQELIRQVGPAVYNVYLLRRLRRRVGALERARFARELHDGAVQSLIAVEMQVDVLRRRSTTNPAGVTEELGRIQSLLREEVLKLRELMQQMKSIDVDSKKLLSLLADTVERFQRETGIAARFISELDEVDMPQQICRELARIVQEGLVNVRKHSRAKKTLVRVGENNGNWTVVIEDDGQGFPFNGRVSHAELDAMGKGPVVIKERVRLIDGELTIESNPGKGARLEISIPQQPEPAYGK